jgi:hypothetical protein
MGLQWEVFGTEILGMRGLGLGQHIGLYRFDAVVTF